MSGLKAQAVRGSAPVASYQTIVFVAACGYFEDMAMVSIREAKNRLTELARRVEQGETIVVTRNGRPVVDLVPHRASGGLDLEAGEAYLREKGITCPLVTYVAADFDEPLPEDILLRPLPPPDQ